MRHSSLLIATLSLVYTLTGVAQESLDSIPGYSSLRFSLAPNTESILSVDADGDGRVDVLSVSDTGLQLFFQVPQANGHMGFDFTKADARIDFEAPNLGWQISNNYTKQGASHGFSILLFVQGQRVIQWSLDGHQFAPPTTLLEGLNGFSGGGINRLQFSQDINADGLEDLVIPGAGSLQLHIRNAEGSYQEPLQVMSDMRIMTRLSLQQSLERETGQSIRIPQIELRDVNNDSQPDIISRTEERFDVFLAQKNASRYFLPTPSYSLDLIEVQERLGSFDVDQLDFSNLTGMLALTHEEILDDVDGDNIADFVLREGGKVSLFKGMPNGMDMSQPRQVLRSGGNVLTSFLFDENQDGRKDLWLWRIEPISVGDIFLWLAISGSVDVEAFVYLNEGETFARRPARKLTVTLKFPSAVRSISTVMEFREQADIAGQAAYTPSTVADINGNTDAADLIVLLEDRVQVFLNALEGQTPPAQDQFLSSLGYNRGQDAYEIDLRRVIEEVEFEGQRDLESIANSNPDYVITLPQTMRYGDIMTTHMNQDSKEDVFIFLERSSDSIEGVLLLSQ